MVKLDGLKFFQHRYLKELMENEILEEIWQTRRKIEKEQGGDLRKVVLSMRKKMLISKRNANKDAAAGKKHFVALDKG